MRYAIMAAVALGAAAVPASAAPVITFNGGQGGNAAGTTVFQNYDSLTSGSSIGTDAFVYSSSGSTASRPGFGSSGNFAAVLANGSYSVAFAASSVFSFVLGSLDTYNTLLLSFEDGTSLSLAGGDIKGGGAFTSGSTGSATSNGLVTYNAGTGPRMVGATFTSTDNSFEFDNLAANGVPEPATWALMILGFGAVGGALRRRTARQAIATA
jgi:hypothetical protein